MTADLGVRDIELFGILADVLGEHEMERDALRVMVGSRGAELGRAFLHLQRAGLVEQRVVEPGFLRRLFGVPETVFVRLSDSGRQFAAEIFAEAGYGIDPMTHARSDMMVFGPEPDYQPVSQQRYSEGYNR